MFLISTATPFTSKIGSQADVIAFQEPVHRLLNQGHVTGIIDAEERGDREAGMGQAAGTAAPAPPHRARSTAQGGSGALPSGNRGARGAPPRAHLPLRADGGDEPGERPDPQAAFFPNSPHPSSCGWDGWRASPASGDPTWSARCSDANGRRMRAAYQNIKGAARGGCLGPSRLSG